MTPGQLGQRFLFLLTQMDRCCSFRHGSGVSLLVSFDQPGKGGVPQPLAVSFLWDEAQATFLTYSLPESERGRLAHIRQNPNVALHFEGSGGDYIIITGEAWVSADDPPADQVPAWVEKYQDLYPRLLGITLKQAGTSATIPLRIRPKTLRYIANPRG